jgi:hypothetical protein
MKNTKMGVAVVVAITLCGASLFGSQPVEATVPGSNTLITMKHDNSQAKGAYVAGSGTLAPMSRDGKFAVFFTSASDDALSSAVSSRQAVVRNIATNTNELASVNSSGIEANQAVNYATLSERGRFVLFSSSATNLVSGITYNGASQTFVRDRIGNTVSLASIDSSGTIANAPTQPRSISNDGRFVLFSTYASAFGASQTQLFVKDMLTGSLTIVSKSDTGTVGNADSTDTGFMSCDGTLVAFSSSATNLVASDTNGVRDLFLADLRNGFKITRFAATATSNVDATDISCNGTYVAFQSASQNLTAETVTGTYTHAFVYDRLSDTAVILDKNYSTGQVDSATALWPAVSDKGQAVFNSNQNSLVSGYSSAGKYHTYIRDIHNGITQILSVNSSGSQDNNGTQPINIITSDGSKAAYLTTSTNLSSTTDTNGSSDYYLSVTGY